MAITKSLTANTGNNTDLTTYTFSSISLGAADGDRHIVVSIQSQAGVPGNVLNSASIQGISANILVQNSCPGANTRLSAIIIAHVPTGTTGDIVLTFSDTMIRCYIGVYRVLGLPSITPFDTDDNSHVSNAAISNAINVPTDGLAIATAAFATNTGDMTNVTWSGITEDFDQQAENTNSRHSGASIIVGGAQTPLNITATRNGTTGVGGSLVSASWGGGLVFNTAIQRRRLLP